MTYHTSEQLNTTRTAEKEETHQDKKAAKEAEMEAVEEAEMEAVEAEHQRRKDKGKDGVARTLGGTLGSITQKREALRRCSSGWQTIRTQKGYTFPDHQP